MMVASDVIILRPHVEKGILVELATTASDGLSSGGKLPTTIVQHLFWHWSKPLQATHPSQYFQAYDHAGMHLLQALIIEHVLQEHRQSWRSLEQNSWGSEMCHCLPPSCCFVCCSVLTVLIAIKARISCKQSNAKSRYNVPKHATSWIVNLPALLLQHQNCMLSAASASLPSLQQTMSDSTHGPCS